MFDVAALLVVGTVAIVVAALVGEYLGGSKLRGLLALGVFIRLIGSTLRVEVNTRFYNALGDSGGYFERGVYYADALLAGDIDSFLTYQGNWWGTQFVRWITSIIVLLTGGNYRASMFAFSLFSFAGLVLIGRAYERASGEKSRTFLTALLLWPSLAYWPASIGKDTVMILALGLTVYGYVGRGDRMRVLHMIAGIGLATCVRPHVAGAFAASVAFAEVSRPTTEPRRNQPRRIGSLFIALAVASVSIYNGLSQLTGGDVDFVTVTEEFQFRADRTVKGGSAIAASSGFSSIPTAFVNVLFRPFPWEAHHIFALVSGLEMWLLWALLLYRYRGFAVVMRNLRRSRFLAFSLPIVVAMTLMYGMAFSNLGIIARQRVIILPFFFAIIALSRRAGKNTI